MAWTVDLGGQEVKIKVTEGQSYVWKPGGDIILGALSLVEPLIETFSECANSLNWKSKMAAAAILDFKKCQ